jgi:subtilisin-like proprotein convertase family protein
LAGNWQLQITDEAAQDVGKLNSWKLELTPA